MVRSARALLGAIFSAATPPSSIASTTQDSGVGTAAPMASMPARRSDHGGLGASGGSAVAAKAVCRAATSGSLQVGIGVPPGFDRRLERLHLASVKCLGSSLHGPPLDAHRRLAR